MSPNLLPNAFCFETSLNGLARTSRAPAARSSLRHSSHAANSASHRNVPPRLRRALQYVPGSFAPEKLANAIQGPADAYVLDLEDSVSKERKDLARGQVAKLFRSLAEGQTASELLVRVNHTSARLELDLQAVLQGGTRALNTVLVPKVNSAEELYHIATLVDSMTSKSSNLQLIASIESARAILDLKEISQSTPRLTGLMFAAEDYCADVGATRTPSRMELLYARSSVVTAAKAYKLSAIDMVCIAHKDLGILQEEAEDGSRLGFTGKQVIHPAQVEVVQRAFAPSAQAIRRAQAILDQMALAEQQGKGAYSLQEEDGSSTMIDAPMILQAKATINAAQQAGLV